MPDSTSSCLDEQTLAALISGELEGSQLRDVEAHLGGCIDCRGLVADAAHGALDPTLGSNGSKGEDAGLPGPGEVLAGKYRLGAQLGRGGMGVVFAAEHLELGHRVAIKFLHSSDPTAAARFLREAKTCARLVNDNIARVFDFGRLPSGVPYFVMEHLVGEDLRQRMARPVPLALALDYVLQACSALDEAHRAGVIHRDLKPGNLFIVRRSDGKPWLKVLDFGISKFVAGGHLETSNNLTLAQSILGSPMYMSPEQIRASQALDARSDIWSMGVILYELVTGQRPFTGSTVSALLLAIATDRPPAPSSLAPDVPVALEKVVLRCLEKDPTARFPDIASLVAALSRVGVPRSLEGSAEQPRPAAFPSLQSALGAARRHPRRLLAFATVLLFGGVGWAVLAHDAAGGSDPVAVTAPLAPDDAPALPPPDPQVQVHCDRPLPTGNVRWAEEHAKAAGERWQRTFDVAWLCEAESSEPRRQELLRALQEAPPATSLVLDPPQLYYSIASERSPDKLALQLLRASHARVDVELTGAHCKEITAVRMRSADGAGGVVTLPDADPGNRCLRHLELPFEAFGKPQVFSFEPAGYKAVAATFTRAQLGVEPQLARVERRNKRAAADPCLPPKFCRD